MKNRDDAVRSHSVQPTTINKIGSFTSNLTDIRSRSIDTLLPLPETNPGSLVADDPQVPIRNLIGMNSRKHAEESVRSKGRRSTRKLSSKLSTGIFSKYFKQKPVEKDQSSIAMTLKVPTVIIKRSAKPKAHSHQIHSRHQRNNLKFGSLKPRKHPFTPEIVEPDEEEDLIFDDLALDLKNTLIEFPFGIISPYSYFKRRWDFLMALVLIYITVILSVRLCFSTNTTLTNFKATEQFESSWLVLDELVDILLAIDIIVNFFSAYENVAGMICSDRGLIAKTYIKNWFFVDLISLFPANLTIIHFLYVGKEGIILNINNYRFWRLFRLVKLIRIIKLHDTIERISLLMTLNLDKIRVFKYANLIFVFVHITSCLWNMTAELEVGKSWYSVEADQELTIIERYVTSVFFCLTLLLTIGYGTIHANNTAERILTIICMLCGIIIYTSVFHSIVLTLAKINQTKSVIEEKKLFYREWIKTFQIPYETLMLVLNTIGSDDSSENARKMETVRAASKELKDLPSSLYIDIYNFVFKDIIEKVDFFRDREKNFTLRLVPLLKQVNFQKKDIIYSTSDPAQEVYFIIKGRISTVNPGAIGREKIQNWVEGNLFGEGDIILKRNRILTLVAEEKSELLKINKKEFIELLDEFPDIRDEVEKLVQIKEMHRLSVSGKKVSNIAVTQASPIHNSPLRAEHLYGSSKLVNILSLKMLKRIKKGHYFKPAFQEASPQNFDFDPDIPSPDPFTEDLLENERKIKRMKLSELLENEDKIQKKRTKSLIHLQNTEEKLDKIKNDSLKRKRYSAMNFTPLEAFKIVVKSPEELDIKTKKTTR